MPAQPPCPNPSASLQRYAERGDEVAFAEFVGHFKGLVYSAAYRRLGSAPLAEEVTQTVFAIVARKASALRKVEHLAAWLHRTATRTASQTARSEARHHRKMKALIDSSPQGEGGDTDDWCALHPHLDDALDRLPERDRRILMLRFFDGLSFQEIAGRVGKSEAAAQRQGHRALEKLAKTLRRKGSATASVTLLTAGLGAQFSSQAPASLATAALADSALLSTSSIGTATLISNSIYTMSQLKTASITAGVIAAALIPLGIQRSAISQQRQGLEEREASYALLAKSADPGGGSSSKRKPLTALGSGRSLSPTERLMGLLEEFEALTTGSDLDKAARASQFMDSLKELTDEELATLLADVRDLDVADDTHDFILHALHEQAARSSGLVALESAKLIQSSRRDYIICSALTAYASHDAESATDWFIAADRSGDLERTPARAQMLPGLFAQVFANDSHQASRLFDAFADDRERHHSLIARSFVENNDEQQGQLLDLALKIEETDFRRWSIGVYAQGLGVRDQLGTGTTDYLSSAIARANLSPEYSAHLYLAAAKGFLNGRDDSVSPDQAIDWIRENTPPEFVERNLREANAYHSSHQR